MALYCVAEVSLVKIRAERPASVPELSILFWRKTGWGGGTQRRATRDIVAGSW